MRPSGGQHGVGEEFRVQETGRRMDRDLETLAASKNAWARLPIERKIALLRAVKRNAAENAAEWVAAAAAAKGLLPGSPLAGEEWTSGPWALLYALSRYIRTLEDIARTGRPRLPAVHTRSDGRVIVNVFPRTPYDRALFSGVRAEVWMQPGVTAEQTRSTAGSFYARSQPEGRVVLVLGAGNISSIAPLDVLYKMLAEGAVCLLKLNPVNEYLGPIFERVLAPLAEQGFLRFAYGGAETGASLCAHPAVDAIHVTGSETTHRAIASAGKPMTSELGNVSPTIVVPGPWSQADLHFQAEQIATQKAHNAGFNCIASQVLVLPAGWTRSDALADAVARVFDSMEQRPEYYPGAAARRAALAGPGSNLRGIVRIAPDDFEHPALTSEAFCGVLARVDLQGDTQQYVDAAVRFANERLHGTLGVNLVIHPATMRRYPGLIDSALSRLRYGCIGVNAWTGLGYLLTETPWGAFPGHTREDPGSGIGVVHNAFLLEGTEKSVVRAPFAPFPRSFATGERTLLPKPPWFVTNTMQAEIGRELCEFESAPSPLKAARIAALALRA